MADTRQTGSNVAPLWCAKVCDYTQRPYIWTQPIRSKISAENTCKWEPMVCTAPSRRGGISSVNCNEGGCYAGRSNRFDSAKCVFEVHGVDSHGKVVVRKTLRRDAVARFFANLPPCLVGMEASNGAHYWARVLSNFGHEVRLISPQFVTPYVKSNKMTGMMRKPSAKRSAGLRCVSCRRNRPISWRSKPFIAFADAWSLTGSGSSRLSRWRTRMRGSCGPCSGGTCYEHAPSVKAA